MVALRGGTYTAVPISATREGVKRVDVDELYDAEATARRCATSPGKPMFSDQPARRESAGADPRGLITAFGGADP